MEEAKNQYQFFEQGKRIDGITNEVKKQKRNERENNISEMNLPRNFSSVKNNASNGAINYAYENKEPENHIPSPNLYTQTTYFSGEYGKGKNSPSINSEVINVRNEIDNSTHDEDSAHMSSSIRSSIIQALEINISRQGGATAIDREELAQRSRNFLKDDDINIENQRPNRLPSLQLPTLVTS